MDQMRAVVNMLCDPSRENGEKPLMLETVLFCPLLAWAGEKLKADGVRRFFIVCAPKFAEGARACFAPEEDVTVSGDRAALEAFLAEDGPVAVLPGPALPVLTGGESCGYMAQAAALRAASGLQAAAAGAPALSGFTAVSSLGELQRQELCCRDAIVRRHMAAGVRFLDPGAVYLDPRAVIGRGTVVLPGTILRERTVIGTDCEIGPNTMIRACTIGDRTVVNASQLNESTVGSDTNVGPFAYVRPGCRIGSHIKVGDFVEVKNSTIGDGTKISHLTYVGDSDVGEKVNFGCGTVTTNYDGFKKYRCTIGNGVFLGCNTNLVAPVTVGDGSYTAAGSTITSEVPPDALAIARQRQTNLPGWAAQRRKLHGQDH
jgi:bifunctional UDP-N-acetylglucosamine pyrophosphorylase/glucosamine-1-phosphate N-acetyltransferase